MIMELLDSRIDFTGCKIALICDGQILTILRDDKEGIPWPNMWELPGGGREGDETPFECVAREVYEELSIQLSKEDIVWSWIYPSMLDENKNSVFLVGQLTKEQFDSIVFGDEGQSYKLVSIEEFLTSDRVIPQLQERVRGYVEGNVPDPVLSMTSLDNDVKRKLENGQYSREKAKAIYEDFLRMKEHKEEGFLIAKAIVIFIIFFFPIMVAGGNFRRLDDVVLALGFLVLFVVLFIPTYLSVYYRKIGRYKRQLRKAMKKYYADVIKECNG
ncbi:MAG: NUDIX hydrolase [Streptococcus parasanguinis]|nr:NUDIX hydrolase [Streptococcus parasanguinis]